MIYNASLYFNLSENRVPQIHWLILILPMKIDILEYTDTHIFRCSQIGSTPQKVQQSGAFHENILVDSETETEACTLLPVQQPYWQRTGTNQQAPRATSAEEERFFREIFWRPNLSKNI